MLSSGIYFDQLYTILSIFILINSKVGLSKKKGSPFRV